MEKDDIMETEQASEIINLLLTVGSPGYFLSLQGFCEDKLFKNILCWGIQVNIHCIYLIVSIFILNNPHPGLS